MPVQTSNLSDACNCRKMDSSSTRNAVIQVIIQQRHQMTKEFIRILMGWLLTKVGMFAPIILPFVSNLERKYFRVGSSNHLINIIIIGIWGALRKPTSSLESFASFPRTSGSHATSGRSLSQMEVCHTHQLALDLLLLLLHLPFLLHLLLLLHLLSPLLFLPQFCPMMLVVGTGPRKPAATVPLYAASSHPPRSLAIICYVMTMCLNRCARGKDEPRFLEGCVWLMIESIHVRILSTIMHVLKLICR